MSDNSNLANETTEPSMEDILSSIRKVIAEDLSKKQSGDDAQAIAGMDIRTEISSGDEILSPVEPIAEVCIDEPAIEAVVDIDEFEPADIEIADLVATGLQEPLESAVVDSTPELNAEFDENDIFDLDDLLGDIDDGDGVMELIQLEDTPPIKQIEEPPKIVTFEAPQEDPAEDPLADLVAASLAGSVVDEQPSDLDFDETLDLVMDADASDYVTTKLAATETPAKELTSDEPAAEFDPMGSLLEDILVEAEDDGTPEKLIAEEMFEPAPEPIPQPEPESESEPMQTGADEDMDLVKSLLEDLMDEPIAAAVGAAVSDETSLDALVDDLTMDNFTGDDFTDDDLLIPDPEAVQAKSGTSETSPATPETLVDPTSSDDVIALELEIEDIFDLGPEEVPAETATITAIDDTETVEIDAPETPESELAQIAREIAEAGDAVANTDADSQLDAGDVVELPTIDFASKLALGAGLAAGASAVAASTLSKDVDTVPTGNSDLEDLQHLMEDTIQDAPGQQDVSAQDERLQAEIELPTQTPHTSIKEDKTMARPMKDDALSDEDTQAEAGNAFASLTSAVQEQAQVEENGPPIGELVKEALKPMLQEWLDKNLKTMVQRAVTKEIKRISSGK